MTVFVDSSAFVALRYVDDPHYKTAKQIVSKLRLQDTQLVTSNFIIAESITVISQKASHQDAIEFYEQDLAAVEIVSISEELEDKAFEIFKKLTSKNVSFVDCISFALMREQKIKTTFTFDEHFRQQGFKVLK